MLTNYAYYRYNNLLFSDDKTLSRNQKFRKQLDESIGDVKSLKNTSPKEVSQTVRSYFTTIKKHKSKVRFKFGHHEPPKTDSLNPPVNSIYNIINTFSQPLHVD